MLQSRAKRSQGLSGVLVRWEGLGDVLECSGRFCEVLGGFGRFWEALGRLWGGFKLLFPPPGRFV